MSTTTAPATRSLQTLTLAGASALTEAAITAASDQAMAIAVAVHDAGGNLLSFARMDGVPELTIEIAQNKSYTAVAFGLPTHQWHDVIKNDEPLRLGMVHTPRLVTYGGGFPLVSAGQVVGAIGISGAITARTCRLRRVHFNPAVTRAEINPSPPKRGCVMPEDHADVTAEAREHLSLYDNTNRLKLGTFATNASYGSSISEAPTSYHVSWQHTVGLAQQAERLGLDMVVPIGRWRGFGGATNFNGELRDLHLGGGNRPGHRAGDGVRDIPRSHHPSDRGRQAGRHHRPHLQRAVRPQPRHGLVQTGDGDVRPELREHDERYGVGDEWVRIVKQLWTDEEPVSFDGRFYTINGAESWPKPIQRPHPVIMNAGSSPAGSDFAARNADINFVTVDDAEVAAALVQKLKANARDNYGRDPQVFSGAYVVCRDTEKEARDAVQSVLDHGDRQAARNLMEVLGVQSGSFDHLMKKGMEDRFITGWGAPAFVGTPEQIADQFIGLEKAGISGITMGFLDYAAELEYFGETVLPLLREAGLRA